MSNVFIIMRKLLYASLLFTLAMPLCAQTLSVSNLTEGMATTGMTAITSAQPQAITRLVQVAVNTAACVVEVGLLPARLCARRIATT